ncbi:MAG: phosphatidylglycerophosphatase A [Verrucomicrobiota bacterium]
MASRFILWLAQGFGMGRIPFAPGTFGSAVGLIWFWILLLPKSPLFFALGILASIFISVWLCGAGEKILHQRDPGSIVMDEIIAIPICFGSWLAILFFPKGFWPTPDYFFSGKNGLMTVGIFLLFRLFDVWKPWPVKQSQTLPGGWGVTIDDVLAALYVNGVVFFWLKFQSY